MNASPDSDEGIPKGEWFEDETFWETFGPLLFDEKRWAEVPAVVDRIEKIAALVPGAAILDACCGVGRHSLEFASRGYRVTGVDLTSSYLEAARESAQAWGTDIEFVHGDIRTFVRPETYDLCVNLFTSFGYFADRSEDLAALVNFRKSLKEGGTLVLETVGKETAVRDFIEGEWFERLGWTVLTEFRPVDAWAGLLTRWILIKGSERIDRAFVQNLYSGTELRRMLLEAGFTSVEIFGSVDCTPYDQKAISLVAVARV